MSDITSNTININRVQLLEIINKFQQNSNREITLEEMCFGIAYTGMQAMMSDDMHGFIKLLLKFSNTINQPAEKLQSFFNIINKYKILTEDNKFKFFKEHEQEINDFFEYKAWFDAIFLAVSKNNFQFNKINHISTDFSGIYSLQHLEHYLETLTEMFEKNITKWVNTGIIGLKLHNIWHTISLGYDIKKQSWLIIDANQLAITNVAYHKTNINELGSIILDTFENITGCIPKKIGFTTKVFCSTAKIVAVIESEFAKLNKNVNWKNIHDPEIALTTMSPAEINYWLHLAIRENSIKNVEKLLNNLPDKSYINQPFNYASDFSKAWTHLSVAASKGYDEVLEILLKNGANINQLDEQGCSALKYATLNNHIKIIKILLAQGANVNEVNNYGNTILHWAASKGYSDVVTILLDNNARLNVYNNRNETPLYWAILDENFDIVKLFIEKGARIDLNSLSIAIKNRNKKIINLITNYIKTNQIGNEFLIEAIKTLNLKVALHLLFYVTIKSKDM